MGKNNIIKIILEKQASKIKTVKDIASLTGLAAGLAAVTLPLTAVATPAAAVSAVKGAIKQYKATKLLKQRGLSSENIEKLTPRRNRWMSGATRHPGRRRPKVKNISELYSKKNLQTQDLLVTRRNARDQKMVGTIMSGYGLASGGIMYGGYKGTQALVNKFSKK